MSSRSSVETLQPTTERMNLAQLFDASADQGAGLEALQLILSDEDLLAKIQEVGEKTDEGTSDLYDDLLTLEDLLQEGYTRYGDDDWWVEIPVDLHESFKKKIQEVIDFRLGKIKNLPGYGEGFID